MARSSGFSSPRSPVPGTPGRGETLQIAVSIAATSRAPPRGTGLARLIAGTSGNSVSQPKLPRAEPCQPGSKLEAAWPEEGTCEHPLGRAWRTTTACWRNACRLPGSGKDTGSKCHAGCQRTGELAGCVKGRNSAKLYKVTRWNPGICCPLHTAAG